MISVGNKEDNIIIEGASEHNLKGFSCELPKHGITLITGPSGAGKTSLAVDTLAAESNFRFNSLKSLIASDGLVQRPKVKRVVNLPPVFFQQTKVNFKWQTVASATSLDMLLAKLFQKKAHRICPNCQEGEIVTIGHEEVIKDFQASGYAAICTIIKRISMNDDAAKKLLDTTLMKASTRIIYDDQIIDLDDEPKLQSKILAQFLAGEGVQIVVDRLSVSEDKERFKAALKLAESLQNAGVVTLSLDNTGKKVISQTAQHFARNGICNHCGYVSFYLSDFLFNAQFASNRLSEDIQNLVGIRALDEKRRGEFLTAELFNYNYEQLLKTSIFDLLELFKNEDDALKQVLNMLVKLGLGHLSPLRSCRTLSHGELQRLQLIKIFSSVIKGSLLVLDEPTMGLHDFDIPALSQALQELNQKGHGIVVVDHNKQIQRIADYQLELGTASGKDGGTLIYYGEPKSDSGIKANNVDISKRVFSKESPYIYLSGISKNNISNLSVKIPLHALSCISGVSGAGKSTLLFSVLLPALKYLVSNKIMSYQPSFQDNASYKSISSDEYITRVVAAALVPEVVSKRSLVGSYIGLFPYLKKLYAQLPYARLQGFQAEDFSFSDDIVREDILKVKFKGISIKDIRGMSASEAVNYFGVVPHCRECLDLLNDFHLAYLPLGQQLNTVSYGELQRLKFVREFSRSILPAVYIFDEPASGLDDNEVAHLSRLFQQYVSKGNTIIAIEHHADFVRSADWLIDLGIKAGNKGGNFLAQGTYHELMNQKNAQDEMSLNYLL